MDIQKEKIQKPVFSRVPTINKKYKNLQKGCLPVLIEKFEDELGVVQLTGLLGGIITYYTEISGAKQQEGSFSGHEKQAPD
jgi:hypothetical protein